MIVVVVVYGLFRFQGTRFPVLTNIATAAAVGADLLARLGRVCLAHGGRVGFVEKVAQVQ